MHSNALYKVKFIFSDQSADIKHIKIYITRNRLGFIVKILTLIFDFKTKALKANPKIIHK